MRDLYLRNRAAIAFLSVQTSDGNESIGIAFHIGDGYFVTAKHVVDGNRILEVGLTQPLVATADIPAIQLSSTSDIRQSEEATLLSKVKGAGLCLVRERFSS